MPQRDAVNVPAMDATAATSSASLSRSGGSKRGKALREHRLAGSRRAVQQHGMPARRGHFERALGERLAAHVGEVGSSIVRSRGQRRRRRRRQRRARRKVRAHREQRARAVHRGIAHQRGFACRMLGQHERAAVAARAQRHGQRAAHGAQLAGQRELAREFVASEVAASESAP